MKKYKLGLLFMVLGMVLFGQSSAILYKSIDGGESWTSSAQGLPSDDRVDVILKDKNAVFALTESHGLYRSDDMGAHWYQPMFAMVLPQKVDALVVHQGLLFAGTYQNGVYVSADQGNSWVAANQGLTDKTFRAFLSEGDLIYVGTNDGIFSSTDKGRNWTQLTNGMQINSFCQTEGLLLAATNRGILQSKNGGKNWDWAKQGLAYQKLSLFNDVIYASTYGPGMEKYSLKNKQWIAANIDFPPNRLYTNILLAEGDDLFIGQDTELFVSYNKGLQWMLLTNGLPESAFFRDLEAVGPNVLLLGIGIKKEEQE